MGCQGSKQLEGDPLTPEMCETLKKVKFFKDLADEEIKMLSEGFVSISPPAENMLVKKGDKGRTYYVIHSGTVTILGDGFEVDLAAPKAFGEIALVKKNPVREVSVRVGKDGCVLLAMEYEAFNKLCEHEWMREAKRSMFRIANQRRSIMPKKVYQDMSEKDEE
mmetsp:Transcript_19047/g.22771  ORF Transcript_19047/g.22771 Transcript_19047/m.22771 type:complete len:164 (+) Transcript_19047:246-737(+)|eukprot:CAMPEP_0197857178 /NCGR_PEP_ID=MMETSP1438-20131217/29994_1 /TAXON_ID=1461541 /ORGANISM="Pterosperma sp., Strain CCMP1384" /LENGTH=163 /DNA_ID=CAMNT_0043472907 /DNA_START=260 /DNA_END=751 /DNA_ORIENTATION=-